MVETRKRKKRQQPDLDLDVASSSSSRSANKNTTPDWLPAGWTVVVWINATGQTYEVFKETATRKKFYSKPEVLNYLGISDTSDSNQTNVKVAPPQKKQVSTLSTKPLEIPQRLYDLIQNAATARKSLKLDSNNRSAKRELKSLEGDIHRRSVYLQCITEELPSDWRYDPETSIAAYVPKLPTPAKSKTKKRQKTKKEIKITWSSYNYHGSYSLNNDHEKEVWNIFKKEEDTTEAQENRYIPYEKYLKTVEKDRRVVDLLGKFAVDTFNRSCKMYVNKDEDNQVSCAEFMECKFYKLTYKYIFYMTIEAIEQGIPGVYETSVECDTKDGAKRLMYFQLTDRKPKGNRPCLKHKLEYETVQDGSSDPQDYYKLTGLVHRQRTDGGGFNYHNPRFSAHLTVYSIRNRRHENFIPNTTRP